MRDLKFRAWAEKTVDNIFEYALEKANTKEIEPNKNSNEWDKWYENRNKYLNEYINEYMEECNKNNSIKERYTKTLEMITDFKVNGKTQQPYGYKIIDIMQYTGLKDKNGVEIYEGDILNIDKEDYKYIVKYYYGCFVGVNKFDEQKIIGNIFKLDIEVIGNIYEKEKRRRII